MLFVVCLGSVRAEPKFPFVLSELALSQARLSASVVEGKHPSAGQRRLRSPKLERLARQASLRLPPSARGEGSC